MNEKQSLLILSWKKAAKELGLDIISPFCIEVGGTSYIYPLLIDGFGSKKGVLVILNGEPQDDKLRQIGIQAGFFVSTVFEAYCDYDRNLFLDTLNDLIWFGPTDRKPEWYTGESWTP